MIRNIATLGLYHTDKSIVNTKLTEIMRDNNDIKSRYYLLAAKEMDKKYGGRDADEKNIGFDKIKDKLESKLYGNVNKFDDGKIIIKSGNQIDKETVLKVYWGIKEVDSQFFRAIGTDEILDGEKDKMDTLTIVIYNDEDDYKYAEFLNDLTTDNGGMYIESDRTIYIYNRYRDEMDIYSLEDISKHEYTHYLQSIYIMNDYFGEGPFYEDDTIIPLQEGEAEYFIGSTRILGVVDNKEVVEALRIDRENNLGKNTILEILEQDYGDGGYLYRYGNSFMNFAIKSNPDIYEKMVMYVRENDFEAYEKYLEFLKTDKKIQKEYDDNLYGMIKNIANIESRDVSNTYLEKHENRDGDYILKDLSLTKGLDNLEYKLIESEDFETIKIEGIYHSDIESQGKILDRLEMNKITDKMLLDLMDLDWSGYGTFTGYFKNHRVDSNNRVIYDMVFHGIKKSE